MKITYVPIEYGCNENCISCPVPRQNNRPNPTWEEIKKSINEIKKYSEHIELNGGEPTLNKNIFKILKYCELKKFKEIALLSNIKFFYYKNNVEILSKIKNIKIITTIYGHNSKIQDAITRTPNSFKYKEVALKNLVEKNINIQLRILVHKMNSNYLEQIANYIISNFKSNDFLSITFMFPKLTATAYQNKEFVFEEMGSIGKKLIKPIQMLSNCKFKINLYHFPHCVLNEKLYKYSSGHTANDCDMTFLDSCNKCAFKNECSAIWKSYILIKGDSEFVPILRTKKQKSQ